MLLYWKVLLPSTSISPVSSTILLVFLYCWSLNSAELGALPPCTVKNVHLTWTSPKLNYSCPLVSLRDWFQDPMWCQYPGVLKGIIWNAIEQCIQLALCIHEFPTMDWKHWLRFEVDWNSWCEPQLWRCLLVLNYMVEKKGGRTDHIVWHGHCNMDM